MIRNTINSISSARIFFFALLWLMVLLIAGTVAQKYIGLYQSQQMFFSSFFFFAGFIPLPGGYTTLGIIFFNLLAKLVFKSPWTKARFGINVVHLGGIMLLFGGFLTAVMSTEGGMVLQEGERSHHFSDYHRVEFVIEHQADHTAVTRFPEEKLDVGKNLVSKALPFFTTVTQFAHNCDIVQRSVPAHETLHGFAKIFELKEKEREKEEEKNSACLSLKINEGHYSVFEGMPIEQTLDIDGGKYILKIQKEERQLPFEIELIDFEKQTYPGTDLAKSYRSEVHLIDGAIRERRVIEMNRPLRYKNYTLYQSSFVQGVDRETSVFAVVKNSGRLFPYVSSVIMCFGLLLHLFTSVPKMIRRFGRCASFLFLFFLLSSSSVFAETEKLDVDVLARIPILHEGRLKPLESFARSELLTVSGKSSLQKMKALEWLCELLFEPQAAFLRSVIRIQNPDVVDTLKLTWNKPHLYTLTEVAKGLSENIESLAAIEALEKEKRTPDQQQLYEIYLKVLRLYHLANSFSFFEPQFQIVSLELSREIDLTAGIPATYLDLEKIRPRIMKAMARLDGKKMEAFTPDELELFHLVHAITRLERDGENSFFHILPPPWKESGEEWLSPWGSILSGKGSPQIAAYLKSWRLLRNAYLQDNTVLWKEATEEITLVAAPQTSAFVAPFRLSLEHLMNRFDFFTKSLIAYGASLLFLLFSWMFLPKFFSRGAFVLFSLGALIHLLGLVMRMIIMERPPVSTLYESILFVSLIMVLFGFIFELIRRNHMGLFLGTVAGVVLLFISRGYAAEGDTLGMLVAVLNTNFWLATHVVTITTGYGTSLVAGILGHVYLVERLVTPHKKERLNELMKNMVGATGVALFFTLFGTILGGIWADQSWGRFWGWDPKENGALLIVLWLLWLLHGRITKCLNDLHYALGMIVTNIIVALAWFGVNLLNIGLHSYGFTRHIVMNLALFCGLELFFGVIMYLLLRRREAI